jgi:hypothetical protein
MIKIESYEDLPEEMKQLYEDLPEPGKGRVAMIPWGMGGCAYRFTDDEKDGLAQILLDAKNKVPEQNIVAFIWELEGLASQKKYEILDTPKKADTRMARQEIIDDGKTFLKHLEAIVTGRRQWVAYEDLQPSVDGSAIGDDDPRFDGRVSDPVTYVKMKVGIIARDIEAPLQELIKTLEQFQNNEKKVPGRDRVDADHLVKLVADAYTQYIGKPSTYPEGPFFKIVEQLLAILGIPLEDPTRAIRQALKK